MPAWDFEGTRASVEGAWRDRLSAVLVEGGSQAERRIFYSALYRAFLMPTVASDVDGGYRFGAGEPAVADGFRFMTDMSLWDTYRTRTRSTIWWRRMWRGTRCARWRRWRMCSASSPSGRSPPASRA